MFAIALGWSIAGRAADPAACPSPAELATVEVTNVYAGTLIAERAPSTPVVKVRQAITLKADNLDVLLRLEQCSATHKKIVLFLDGRPMPSIPPFPPARPDTGTLAFLLNRTEEARDTWVYLLGKPTFKPRLVAVSIGLEDSYAVNSSAVMALDVIPTVWLLIWLAFFAVLLAVFLRLASRTGILRDTGPAPASGKMPFSLARTQAAVWFFLIVASYLFIGLITGDYSSPITSTVLALMGISGGTVIGSSIIDQSQTAAAPAATPAASAGWWRDILSDSQGVNFHRFQMAVWTFVLGVVFIQQVYRNLSMPDFDNTLLGLLGISAGTYLGLKTTTE